MSEKPIPFVITDRRKFTPEGEPRPDAAPSERPGRESAAAPSSGAPSSAGSSHAAVHEMPAPADEIDPAIPASADPGSLTPPIELPRSSEDAAGEGSDADADDDASLPPPPSSEQMEQSRLAFDATADRLDTAIRAANPGADHPPALTFESLVQSVYMQAILQLGGGTQEGQQPQVDILGARQSIDMLGILAEKTRGNLSAGEENLLSSALFELRLAFLEITQALARSAQQRAGGNPPGGPSGPRIVR